MRKYEVMVIIGAGQAVIQIIVDQDVNYFRHCACGNFQFLYFNGLHIIWF